MNSCTRASQRTMMLSILSIQMNNPGSLGHRLYRINRNVMSIKEFCTYGWMVNINDELRKDVFTVKARKTSL